MAMKIDFENLVERCKEVVDSEQYGLMAQKIVDAKKIFLVGNGGLHFVASHMSTDMSRLIPKKAFYSFDSVGFITSNANDHGFEHMFVRWLETIADAEDPNDCLIIGLSCSGNSANVINALHYAEEEGMSTFMVSGQKSESLNDTIDELSFEFEFFHTVEVAIMILFYEMIHQVGSRCPSINGEKVRLADSPLRMGQK